MEPWPQTIKADGKRLGQSDSSSSGIIEKLGVPSWQIQRQTAAMRREA